MDEVVEDGVTTYVPSAITNFDFNGGGVTVEVNEETGEVTLDMEEAATLAFDSVTGRFKNITVVIELYICHAAFRVRCKLRIVLVDISLYNTLGCQGKYQNDTQLAPDAEGRVANIQFYDNLGNLYTMELNIKHAGEDDGADTESNSTYAVRVANVYDEKGKSIFVDEVVEDGVTTYVPTVNLAVLINADTRHIADRLARALRRACPRTARTLERCGTALGEHGQGGEINLYKLVVATFPNAAGLEAVGNNMFATTQNSGSFDGIGKDILTTGGKFNPGVIEMSNVDLANEFTAHTRALWYRSGRTWSGRRNQPLQAGMDPPLFDHLYQM